MFGFDLWKKGLRENKCTPALFKVSITSQSLANQHQGRNLWLPRQTGSGWAHKGCWWCRRWDGAWGRDSERKTSHYKSKTDKNRNAKLGCKILEFLNMAKKIIKHKHEVKNWDKIVQTQYGRQQDKKQNKHDSDNHVFYTHPVLFLWLCAHSKCYGKVTYITYIKFQASFKKKRGNAWHLKSLTLESDVRKALLLK